MEKKRINRLFIVTLVLLLIVGTMYFLKPTTKTSVPSDYQDMTAGQLLDVSLGLKAQITAISTQKAEVDKLMNSKIVAVGGTIQEETNSIDELSTSLNLR